MNLWFKFIRFQGPDGFSKIVGKEIVQAVSREEALQKLAEKVKSQYPPEYFLDNELHGPFDSFKKIWAIPLPDSS
jgi:hypothetical protein